MIKVYFYQNGIELKDHPLNGATLMGAGPFIAPPQNGKTVRSNIQITRSRNLRGGNYKTENVTIADFGGKPVEVKEWYPGIDGKGYSEWYILSSTDCAKCERDGLINCPDHKHAVTKK